MANDLAMNPIKIDTAGATSEVGRRDGGYFVQQVIWVDPSTAGHTFSISSADGGDKVLLTGVADADNKTHIFKVNQQWANFEVDTLASGVLYIYLAPRYTKARI